jgi:hypothetical protein
MPLKDDFRLSTRELERQRARVERIDQLADIKVRTAYRQS